MLYHSYLTSGLFNCALCPFTRGVVNIPCIYYVAELVPGEKEHSKWFPERSIYMYMDC